MRKKALLAIAVATGMLNSTQPSFASDGVASGVSAKQRIVSFATSKEMPPEYRARQLISFASYLLRGESSATAESRYLNSRDVQLSFVSDDGAGMMSSWASNEVRCLQLGLTKLQKKATIEQKSLAESAVIEAERLACVSRLKDSLPLEFAISSLWKSLNKTDAFQRCNRRIDRLLIRCEKESKPDFDEIRAAAAVLNFEAGSIGSTGFALNDAKSFHRQPEAEFRRSEKSRLRAVKLLDRLPRTDHQRRMAHRDLSVMYRAQGKNDLAEKEKQILFQLVGIADDSILMPTSGGCGHLIWWRHQTVSQGYSCGMG